MTKDCQCHRLFYPTLTSSRSSNHMNSLKAKTTISPVITTLRTIAVMQRKKRKNEDLFPRSKLSKSSYTVNQLDSQPGPIAKRNFHQDLFEYDYRQFKQSLFSSPDSQSFHTGGNRFFVELDRDALRLKQGKLTKQVANQTELSQVSSNSNTCTNIPSDYDRRNNRYKNSGYRSHAGKENYDGSRKQPIGASNWKIRPMPTESSLSPNPNYSPKIDISEDRDQLIFNMSPFSFTQTLSTVVTSSANHPRNRNSVKALDRKKIKNDDLAEESDEDEDESLISITSVLPIDIIPQSHKSI